MKRWSDDIVAVDKIVKLLGRKNVDHNKSKEIRENATQLLSNKSQIDGFMAYDKERKLKKVQ